MPFDTRDAGRNKAAPLDLRLVAGNSNRPLAEAISGILKLPLAYFAGTLYGLNRLNSESELVVMQAAGYSRMQLMVPVIVSALLAMAGTWLCSLYLMPLTQHTMRDAVLDIRADIGAAILNEGDFNTPTNGLTVFIRELDTAGGIKGILVHDSRNAKSPTTYIAETGILAQTTAGGRLIMLDGTIEQSGLGGAKLLVLKFKRYVFNLDQFAGPQQEETLDMGERFLPDLFWPKFAGKPSPKIADIYFAEGHNRLSAPLYCLAFALIALAAVTRRRRGRGAYVLRLTTASIIAAVLRLIGYGAQGAAARTPLLCLLLYLIPLVGVAAALIDMQGLRFAPLLHWLRPRQPEGAP